MLTFLVTLTLHNIIVGLSSTYAISAYHHWRCVIELRWWRSALNTTLCDKVCQWSVVLSRYSGFLHQKHWPPWHNWNIVEIDVYHHKPDCLYRYQCNYFPICSHCRIFFIRGPITNCMKMSWLIFFKCELNILSGE